MPGQPQAEVQTPVAGSQQEPSAAQQPGIAQQLPPLQQSPPTQQDGAAAVAFTTAALTATTLTWAGLTACAAGAAEAGTPPKVRAAARAARVKSVFMERFPEFNLKLSRSRGSAARGGEGSGNQRGATRPAWPGRRLGPKRPRFQQDWKGKRGRRGSSRGRGQSGEGKSGHGDGGRTGRRKNRTRHDPAAWGHRRQPGGRQAAGHSHRSRSGLSGHRRQAAGRRWGRRDSGHPNQPEQQCPPQKPSALCHSPSTLKHSE